MKYNEDRRGFQDINDIVELLLTNNISTDENWFIELCNKYGTKEIYEQICKMIQKRK